MALNFRNIMRYMRKKDYVIYEKPYQLNIVGIRNAESQPNKFDDQLFVFYKNENNQWVDFQYPITTDTGTYWLLNPMSNQGTAMLKEGQYVDAYKQGYHKGQYLALVQAKPVTVYRDYDRDALFDVFTKEQTGEFGINIHKAGENSQNVDNWSAGCQVFQKSSDFQQFMTMTTLHSGLFGNNFTYTLIDERAIRRRKRKIIVFVSIGAIAASIAGVFLYRKFKK